MSDWQLNTPVAFIIFNRPDTTRRVFSEIAKVKPPKLLVVADGPRANRYGEENRCLEARSVIEGVDWDCQVLTNFSDVNLGCRGRVSSGLDWVFEQVPEAIVLEDDCLPHPSFFRFCEEMLDYYRMDERVSMISGDNFQFGQKRGDASYYFSRFMHIWGWASWRRAWQNYDCDANKWATLRCGDWLETIVSSKKELKFWKKSFQGVYSGKIDTWDHQWTLTSWGQEQMSIMPNVNLVSNIGFGSGATHTHGESVLSEMPVEEMVFPVMHPDDLLVDKDADSFTADHQFFLPTFKSRAIAKLKSILFC